MSFKSQKTAVLDSDSNYKLLITIRHQTVTKNEFQPNACKIVGLKVTCDLRTPWRSCKKNKLTILKKQI